MTGQPLATGLENEASPRPTSTLLTNPSVTVASPVIDILASADVATTFVRSNALPTLQIPAEPLPILAEPIPSSAVSIRTVRSPSPTASTFNAQDLLLPPPSADGRLVADLPTRTRSRTSSRSNSRARDPTPANDADQRPPVPRRTGRPRVRRQIDIAPLESEAGSMNHPFNPMSGSLDAPFTFSPPSSPPLGRFGKGKDVDAAFKMGSGPLEMTVEVVLEREGGDRVEMFGGPRTGTCYSLPGHLILTIPTPPPATHQDYSLYGMGCGTTRWGGQGLGRERELKSLEVIFEGKSDYWDDSGRYQVLKLCKIVKSLMPTSGGPLTLPPPLSSSTLSFTKYAIPFDLSLPGWLPQSVSYDMTSTSYGLVGRAVLGWSAPPPSGLGAGVGHMQLGANGTVEYISNGLCPSAPVPIASVASSSKLSIPRMTRSFLSSALAASGINNHFSQSHTTTASSFFIPISVDRHRVEVPLSVFSAPSSGEAATIVGDSAPALRHFTLKPTEDSPSPLETVVSVPEIVDINATSLKVSIRLRARKTPMPKAKAGPEGVASVGAIGMDRDADGDVAMADVDGRVANRDGDEMDVWGAIDSQPEQSAQAAGGKAEMISVEELGKTVMCELGMEMEEVERFYSVPSQSYLSSYPIPEDQPTLQSLKSGPGGLLGPVSKHSELAAMGMAPSTPFKGMKCRSLLLGDDDKPRTYRFDGEGLELGAGWRKVNVIIPMPGRNCENGGRKPLAEMENPFARIKHKLKIRVVCRSDNMPGQDTIVVLTTPLRCGSAPLPRGTQLSYLSGLAPLSAPSLSSLSPLPAYSQIFHENGASKECEEPLPLYIAQDTVPAFEPISGARLCQMGIPIPASPPQAVPERVVESAREGMDMDRDRMLSGTDAGAELASRAEDLMDTEEEVSKPVEEEDVEAEGEGSDSGALPTEIGTGGSQPVIIPNATAMSSSSMRLPGEATIPSSVPWPRGFELPSSPLWSTSSGNTSFDSTLSSPSLRDWQMGGGSESSSSLSTPEQPSAMIRKQTNPVMRSRLGREC